MRQSALSAWALATVLLLGTLALGCGAGSRMHATPAVDAARDVTTAGTTDVPIAPTDVPTVSPAQAVGRACTLPVQVSPGQALYSASASECPSRLCIKPMVEPGASGSVDTAATCTAECTRDSDCTGELRDRTDAADKRCMKGFACGMPFSVGALCCKKLCVCKDFLGPSGATSPAACREDGSSGGVCPASVRNQPLGSVSGAEQETDVQLALAPSRQVDLVVMVDNSPAMAPKVNKLNAQFPQAHRRAQEPP